MSKSISVAMIIQGYHPCVGGAERQLAAVAPLLQAQGVEVHVLTRRYAGLASFELINGVPVYRLPIPGPKAAASMAFTLGALALLRRLRPQVIHAHELLSPATTAVAARRLLGIPVVAKVLRGGVLGDLAKLKRKAFGQRRIVAFRAHVDAFVTISREIDTELAELGVPAERRCFIPNGVDTGRFAPLPAGAKPAHRAALGLPGGPTVIFTGRLSAEKRIDHLIGAWPAVRAAYPDASLLVVGEGPEETRLKEMAGAGVWFAGRVEDVAPYLQAADIFVLPSVTEGLSNSLLEALSSGLAAIATVTGGATDVITHRENGWLIPPEAPDDLLAALLALLGDAEQRTRLGQQGRERVIRDYALPITARRLHALYDQLVYGNNRLFKLQAAQKLEQEV